MSKGIRDILKKITYYSILNRRAFLEEEGDRDGILEILGSPIFKEFKGQFDAEFDKIFKAPPLSWKSEELKRCFWLGERIGVLLWGINLIDSMPPFDTPFNISEINACLLKVNRSDVKLSFRNRKDLVKFYKLVDLYSWRVGMYVMKMNGILPPEPYTYKSMFDMIMDKVFKEGLVKKNIYNDLIILGKPFDKLTKEEFFRVAAIIKERNEAVKILIEM